jgi:hypothetical protein
MSGGKGDEGGVSGVKEGTTVVQQAVREVGGGTAFPVLTKTNYSDWTMLIRVKLKVRGLWVAIDKGGVDPQEDRMALDALVSVVPPEMVANMADKLSTKEAWDAITTMRVGDERVKKAATQQLCSQFDHATFREGESVKDFSIWMNSMVATLATLGEVVEEHKVVEKILRCVPPQLKRTTAGQGEEGSQSAALTDSEPVDGGMSDDTVRGGGLALERTSRPHQLPGNEEDGQGGACLRAPRYGAGGVVVQCLLGMEAEETLIPEAITVPRSDGANSW